MNISPLAPDGAQPVAGTIGDQLLEPFIAAVAAALGEMAGAELAVRNTYQTRSRALLGDIRAQVELKSAAVRSLVLSFPLQTATALAGRILAGVNADLDDFLIRDCMGEIGNVVAGQAKALLAGTPYRLVFSLPEVSAGPDAMFPEEDLDCLVVILDSAQGEFALQLFLKLSEVRLE